MPTVDGPALILRRRTPHRAPIEARVRIRGSIIRGRFVPLGGRRLGFLTPAPVDPAQVEAVWLRRHHGHLGALLAALVAVALVLRGMGTLPTALLVYLPLWGVAGYAVGALIPSWDSVHPRNWRV